MSNDPETISPTKLLLGEGKDEVLFFQALLAHLQIEDIQVMQYGGRDVLRKYLKSLVMGTDFYQIVSLGITRDADNSATSAFTSVCGSLKNCGLPAPSQPGQIVGDKPKISVLILPDSQNPGMLEDVCLKAVDPKELQCVDDYLNCMSHTATPQPKNRAKARLNAWLSAQAKPGLRLGEAAQNGYLPWNNNQFHSLKQFLQAM